MNPNDTADIASQAPEDIASETRFSIRFWGVRGSIATPGPATSHYGGNTSCVEARIHGQIIILDAGTGIRPLGLNLAREAKGRPLSLNLLLSHTHWDHIQGFPFFGPAYDPKNRLRIRGYKGARDGLLTALSSQMSSYYFPVGWQQLPSSIDIEELKDLSFQIGPVAVKSMFLNHPGGCVGYRLSTPGRSFAYLTDNEPFHRYATHSKTQSAGESEALAVAKQKDLAVIEFIRDADILVMDAQYDATEYASRVGWGHACLDDAVAMALEANVKRLYLFHHDPDHDDERVNDMVRHAREIIAASGKAMLVEGAREGMEVAIPQ